MRIVFYSTVIILILITPNVNTTEANDGSDINFKLRLMAQSGGSPTSQSMMKVIKSNLKSLGIDVEIIVKEPTSYVYDSYHVNAYDGLPDQWDMILAERTLGGLNPLLQTFIFEVFLDTESTWTDSWQPIRDKYRLYDPEWQEWQLSDTGINQTDIDVMIRELLKENDVEIRNNRFIELQNLFMEKLLYYIPIMNGQTEFLIRKELERFYSSSFGVVGCSTSTFGSFLPSIYEGATWESNPTERSIYADDTTLNVGLKIPGEYDYCKYDMSGPVHSSFMMYAEDGSIHPDLAIQWEMSDWTDGNGIIYPNREHKIILRDDAYWKIQGVELNSSYFGTNHVTIKDFLLSYSFHRISENPLIDNWLDSMEINETENSITMRLTDDGGISNPYRFGMGVAGGWGYFDFFPSFVFQDKIIEFNSTISGNVRDLLDLGLDLTTSDGFVALYDEARQYTVGPYEIFVDENDIVSFQMREDYYFPNEWDSPSGDFIIHDEGLEDAHFFTYNQTAEFINQKPTEFTIDTINYIDVDPDDEYSPQEYLENHITLLKEGRLDMIMTRSSFQYDVFENQYKRAGTFNWEDEAIKNLQSIRSNPDYQTYVRDEPSFMILEMDLQNPHLKNFEVREAISLAINRDLLSNMTTSLMRPVYSPVVLVDKSYSEIPGHRSQEYAKARDIMRQEINPITGEHYWAAESQKRDTDILEIPSSSIPIPDLGFIGNREMIGILLIALSLPIWLRKRNPKFNLDS